jgi:nitrite reductase (NO-forming)
VTDDADQQHRAGGPDAPLSVSRRGLLKRVGIGGAALLGGGLVARDLLPRDPAASADGIGHAAHACPYHGPTTIGGAPAAAATTPDGHGYGHGAGAPIGLDEGTLMAATVPPPFDGRRGVTRTFDLPVTERQVPVADGVVVDAWTYAGTAPGPILRATVGDTLRLRMANRTSHAHNLHLHGSHHPSMDGWEPIPPGQEFTYEVEAGPVGLHPYHCHTSPLAEHVARGLYGALIVDPPGGRPPAHEVVLVLGGWDVDGDGRIEVACWNGIAGGFATHPIKVPVGAPVRCYLVNMLEYEPVGSFHLHAQTFDVFRSGTSLTPDEHTDTITLGQGERAILEFALPHPGRYMFHPHQHRLADMGAMGWFAAI